MVMESRALVWSPGICDVPIMPQDMDPWCAELRDLLGTLKPEAELDFRLALEGEFPRLRGRAEWSARTNELTRQICRSANDWRRILTAA
jgi:hypothetical protein